VKLRNFRLRLRQMWRSKSGAIAPLWALAMLMLAPITAVTVDSTYAWNAKRNLQEALDAALLGVAREGVSRQRTIDTIASRYVNANLASEYGATGIRLRVWLVGDGHYRGSLSADVRTFFGGVVGISSIRAGVDGEVKSERQDVEVVLSLDTTASMRGSRIAALKDAANDFVRTMVRDADGVKVGIVPFSRYVNIGRAHRNEPGFDIPSDGRSCRTETRYRYEERNCRMVPTPGGGTCVRQVNCREESYTGQCDITEERYVPRTCTDDGVSYECGAVRTVVVGQQACRKQRHVCDIEAYTCPPGEERRCDTVSVPFEHTECENLRWEGCVGSRDPDENATDDYVSSRAKGIMNYSCGTELQRLTDRLGPLQSTISRLDVNDETYLPIGLSMGWATLSHRIPFRDGTVPGPSNKNLIRAMILMTDGLNTVSYVNNARGEHFGTSRSDADTLTAQLCENIKRDDILLFTVAFEVSDAGVLQMLRNCATLPNYAFAANDATNLHIAFGDIADALARLRLTQ